MVSIVLRSNTITPCCFLPSVADTISRLYLTLIAVLYQTTLWEQTHVTSRLPRERCTRSSLWLRKNTLPEKAKISVKQVSFIAKLKIREKHWHGNNNAKSKGCYRHHQGRLRLLGRHKMLIVIIPTCCHLFK